MRPDIDPATLIKPEEIADILIFLLKFRGNAVIDEINVRRKKNSPWRSTISNPPLILFLTLFLLS